MIESVLDTEADCHVYKITKGLQVYKLNACHIL